MKSFLIICILVLLPSCSRPVTSGKIVRKGVDFQGHYIDIEQWSGRGTEFWKRRVYLPRLAVDSLKVGERYKP